MRLSRKDRWRLEGQEAVEDAEDFGVVEIKKLPTMIELRCPCGHSKRASSPHGQPRPRFRCSKCGTLAL